MPSKRKHILFIQGGGDDGYEVDKDLVASLQTALKKDYPINYREIKCDVSVPDFGWLKQISKHIIEIEGTIILVGHSFGASMILKLLSEHSFDKIEAVFLIATPFWNGDEDWQTGLLLKDNFADKLPEDVPFFLYHCEDDEEIRFSHLILYQQKLARATFRKIKTGGHQLNNDLTLVASDIKAL